MNSTVNKSRKISTFVPLNCLSTLPLPSQLVFSTTKRVVIAFLWAYQCDSRKNFAHFAYFVHSAIVEQLVHFVNFALCFKFSKFCTFCIGVYKTLLEAFKKLHHQTLPIFVDFFIKHRLSWMQKLEVVCQCSSSNCCSVTVLFLIKAELYSIIQQLYSNCKSTASSQNVAWDSTFLYRTRHLFWAKFCTPCFAHFVHFVHYWSCKFTSFRKRIMELNAK